MPNIFEEQLSSFCMVSTKTNMLTLNATKTSEIQKQNSNYKTTSSYPELDSMISEMC